MQRFTVCGEALIDLVPEQDVDRSDVDSFHSSWAALSAGGPMNTAIALARLGNDVQFCGRLSRDRFGRQLQRHLAGNGVRLERAVVVDDPTSLAVVSLDERAQASYTFHFAGTANFAWRPEELPQTSAEDWLHLASLALVVPPGAAVLADWAAAHGGPMSIDLNVRPAVIPDPQAYWSAASRWIEIVGARGGVLKASDEDVAFLARGSGDRGEAIDVLGRWAADAGCSLAVVTLGAQGAAASAPDGTRHSVPGRRVEVVDTVGAGDTFMAGFLSAYATGADVDDALRRGVDAAAFVCTRRGAQPPSRDELRSFAAGSRS